MTIFRIVKFSCKIGVKKLSVTYYQETRRNKLKGLKQQTFPIYFTIIYNKETLRVRSILWKRLIEANSQFVFGFVDRKRESILEGSANIESGFLRDKRAFTNLCEYEFECLRRIIAFAHQENPKSVRQIVEAYNYWGADGLREASYSILLEIIGDTKAVFEKISRRASLLPYRAPSLNARVLLRDLLDSGHDPVSLIGYVHETRILDNARLPASLLNGFNDLHDLIEDLALSSFYSVDLDRRSPTDVLPPLGIFYFPRIHFFYPISTDMSVGGVVNRLLKLSKLLSRK